MQDSYLDAKIVVSKFTGGKWTTVGGGPLSDESCLYARLALDGEDKPWVIYQDGAQKEKSTVKKLNAAGTGWSLVGTGKCNTALPARPSGGLPACLPAFLPASLPACLDGWITAIAVA